PGPRRRRLHARTTPAPGAPPRLHASGVGGGRKQQERAHLVSQAELLQAGCGDLPRPEGGRGAGAPASPQAGVEAPGRTEIQAGAQGGPLLEEGRWLRRASLLGSRADTRIVARMHLRIFGFSASLVLLAALGWVLVQTPTPYGEPVEPEPEEEVVTEAEEYEEETAEPPEEDLLAEEDAEEVDVEELRRQAEDAQRRVAEHLEAARRAQEEA